MIKLVAFLGNFGGEYEKTRHNVAWYFEDSLPFAEKLNWQSKFKGEIAAFSAENLTQWACDFKILQNKDGSPVIAQKEPFERIYFLKPQTYMNLSGESVAEISNFYKIKSEEILIVHDELELELGFASLKWSGGLGGHNGLRSVKSVLNTPDFWRLRFGISRPQNEKISVSDWVLSKFSAEQRELLQNVFCQTNLLLVKILLSQKPADFLQGWGKKKLV